MSQLSDSFQKHVQFMMDRIPGYCMITDREHRYLAANEAYIKLIGYESMDQIKGKSLDELNTPLKEDQSVLESIDDDILETREQIMMFGANCFSEDDQKVTMACKSPFFDLENNVIGVFNVFFEVNTQTFFGYVNNWLDPKKNHMLSSEKAQDNLIKTYKNELGLTKREAQIVFHLVQGKTAKLIGEALNISHRTVEVHISKIKSKLQCDSSHHVIKKAIKAGSIYFVSKGVYSVQIPMNLATK